MAKRNASPPSSEAGGNCSQRKAMMGLLCISTLLQRLGHAYLQGMKQWGRFPLRFGARSMPRATQGQAQRSKHQPLPPFGSNQHCSDENEVVLPTLSGLLRYGGQPLSRFRAIEARPELIGTGLKALREFEAIRV